MYFWLMGCFPGKIVIPDEDKEIITESQPSQEPAEPSQEPSSPTSEPTEPSSEPASQPSAPTSEPASPTSEPTSEPSEPASPSSEPTSEPTSEPSEPTSEPSQAPQEEVCDGIDNDGDGDIDEGLLIEYYLDSDGDGFGDPSQTTTACEPPSGYSETADDCDDTNQQIHPDAAEVCDGWDNNCDGSNDDGVCPCNLETYGGHNYLFCQTQTTWFDAQAHCQSMGSYQLTSINDASEQSWIWGKTVIYGSFTWWWLGYHNQNATSNQEPDGGWEWLDGSATGYENWYPWHPQQPDNSNNNEDCAHIDPSHSHWNDLDCNSDNWYGTALFYICESQP